MSGKLVTGLILLILIFGIQQVGAVTKPVVAIFDLKAEGVSQQIATMATRSLSSTLSTLQKVTVLERERIDAILSVQGENLSDCTEEGCAIKLGQILDVEMVVLGEISRVGKVTNISGRIIDVETGRHVVNKIIPLEASDETKILDVIPDLGQQLSAGIPLKVIIIRIKEDNEILIDAGTGLVKESEILKFNRVGERFQHPVTGEWITDIEVVGSLRVIRVIDQNLASCKPVKGKNFKVGDFTEVKQLELELKGNIVVSTDPVRSKVYFDGKSAGYAGSDGLTIKAVPVGSHYVKAKKSGYHTSDEKEISVSHMSTNKIQLHLTPKEWEIKTGYSMYQTMWEEGTVEIDTGTTSSVEASTIGDKGLQNMSVIIRNRVNNYGLMLDLQTREGIGYEWDISELYGTGKLYNLEYQKFTLGYIIGQALALKFGRMEGKYNLITNGPQGYLSTEEEFKSWCGDIMLMLGFNVGPLRFSVDTGLTVGPFINDENLNLKFSALSYILGLRMDLSLITF